MSVVSKNLCCEKVVTACTYERTNGYVTRSEGWGKKCLYKLNIAGERADPCGSEFKCDLIQGPCFFCFM